MNPLHSLDLSSRVPLGQPGSLGQHPDSVVAAALTTRYKRSCVRLQHGHLCRERYGLDQDPPRIGCRDVPRVDDTNQLRQSLSHSKQNFRTHVRIVR